MKIDLLNCTEFQVWVICSMTALAPNWKPQEENDITFTVNGVEVNFYAWCDRLEKTFDEAIEKEASEIVGDDFQEITNTAYELFQNLETMRLDFERVVSKRLGLPYYGDE